MLANGTNSHFTCHLSLNHADAGSRRAGQWLCLELDVQPARMRYAGQVVQREVKHADQ